MKVYILGGGSRNFERGFWLEQKMHAQSKLKAKKKWSSLVLRVISPTQNQVKLVPQFKSQHTVHTSRLF